MVKYQRLLNTLFVLILGAAAASAQASPDARMTQAWLLGSKLSLAATLHAHGAEAGLTGRQFASAVAAANSFGIKLPPLPTRTGKKVEDTASVLNYLLNQTGNPIGGMLVRSDGQETAAVFEVALKSNILLIMYGPGDSTTNTISGVIKARSANAKFLGGMTSRLLELIQSGASYDSVKAELFNIHDLAPKYLALIEYSRNGESKYAAKDYAGSATEFNKALAIDPTGSEYFFGRARAYSQLGKNAEAIADYSKVIQMESAGGRAKGNLAVAYHNRGLLYGMTGKSAPALADLTNAIKLRPDYASAFKIRGLVYQKMGNAKLAAADLATAERLQPGITK
jgi:tetratricopeptide (TPR) repeat protein